MSAFRWSDDHAEGVDFGEPQPEAVQEVQADPALAADAADAALAADADRLAVQEDMNFRANDQAELSAQARKRLASPNKLSKHKAKGSVPQKPKPPAYPPKGVASKPKGSVALAMAPPKAPPRPAPKAADAALAADADSTSEEEQEEGKEPKEEKEAEEWEETHEKFTVGCFNCGGRRAKGEHLYQQNLYHLPCIVCLTRGMFMRTAVDPICFRTPFIARQALSL